MKCPYCDYTCGYELNEKGEYVEHDSGEGAFYVLSNNIHMVKIDDDKKESVYGCPKCGKLFIEV